MYMKFIYGDFKTPLLIFINLFIAVYRRFIYSFKIARSIPGNLCKPYTGGTDSPLSCGLAPNRK